MTVGELIAKLQAFEKSFGPDALVMISAEDEETRVDDRFNTFIPSDASFEGETGYNTYLGDRRVLRINFDQDEP